MELILHKGSWRHERSSDRQSRHVSVWFAHDASGPNRTCHETDKVHDKLSTDGCELGTVCSRDHDHIPLLERRAGPAAVYTEELCRCICKGIVNQKLCDKDKTRPIGKIHQLGLVKPQDLQENGKLDGKHEEDGEDAVLCPTLNGLKERYKSGEADCAWDDVTGAQLNAN